MGPKLMHCCKPEPMGTQGMATCCREFKSRKMVWFQQQRQEIGGLKDNKEESQKKSIRDF